MKPIIEFDDVRVTMQPEGREARFSFSIASGQWTAFVGPNRSGKSLILKLCAGLVQADAGRVRLFGEEIAALDEAARDAWRRRLGIVLQQPGLLSNMTIFNNVALPLRYHGDWTESEVERTVMEHLDAIGLAAHRDRFPAELNRGEMRAVATARVFAMRCEIALFDDPAEGLDVDMIDRLAHVFAQYRDTRRTTIVMTAGAPSSLLRSVDRLGFVRDGCLMAFGPREDVLSGHVGLHAYVGG